MEGFEVPLAAWRVHETATEVSEERGDTEAADRYRALSRATILELASSLPANDPVRHAFVTAPPISRILARAEIPEVA
jgi:hypothetical protein